MKEARTSIMMKIYLLHLFSAILAAEALRTNFKAPSSDDNMVENVVMVKTSDAGSTFLDMRVFPKIPHVARWRKEIENQFQLDSAKMLDYFTHAPGELIVGASINGGMKCMVETVAGLSDGKHGKVLFIHLRRNPVEKMINVMRRAELEQYGCTKNNMHSDECATRKTFIDPKKLLRAVEKDDNINQFLNELITNTTNKDSQSYFIEKFDYHELLNCQGIPQRINQHFGNNVDACDHSSTFQETHSTHKIKDLISNLDEMQRHFRGTKWEADLAPDNEMFASIHDVTAMNLMMD